MAERTYGNICILTALLATSGAPLSGCGGPQKEVKAADVELEEEDDGYTGVEHIGATAEVGALPEEDSVYAFRESFDEIQRCFIDGARRIDFIGGEISFQVWVNAGGDVEVVYADISTLGDRATEECMFAALRSAPWPKPVGGPIGVAQNAFEFEMTGDVRPPVQWDESEVEETLAEQRSEIASCKAGSSERFLATAYVDTDGTPMAVGMAAPNREDEAKSKCLVQLIEGLTFPSPGSWPSKVTFNL